jgi:hypothetical protein
VKEALSRWLPGLFVSNDQFDPSPFGRLDELAGVFQAFNVKADHAGFRIIHEECQHFSETDVQTVSQADDLAHPRLLPHANESQEVGHATALTHQGNPSFLKHGELRSEGGVEALMEVDHAESIRPNDDGNMGFIGEFGKAVWSSALRII